MRLRRWFSGTIGLREAAAVIFALVALLPFLVSLYLLGRHQVLARTDAQITVLLALAVALLGFVVFRRMASQIAALARSVATPAEGGPAGGRVPGLGRVAEIGQIGDAFARMLEELRTATERLEDLVFKLGALNEIVELAARIPRIQDLLALVLERTMRTVRASFGSIMLLDPERQALTVVAARGLPDGAGARTEVRVGEGIAGQVVETGAPIVVDDIEGDPRFAGSDEARPASGAFIAMPVRVEHRIIGVINLARTDPARGGGRGFGSTDVQFLNTLMTHVAYSLDNARLLAEAQQSATRLAEAVGDLQTAQARLTESEMLRAMGQMAAGMAHHLNNLLAVVSGRIQLLLRKVTDPEVVRPLETVLGATRDAAEVVRRVVGFTATEPLAESQAVDLNELVREVVEVTRPRWEDLAQVRGATIETTLELGALPTLAGEPTALREVLVNLVLNAVEALPQGGRITIRTWAAADGVYCAVADTGVGMTEEVRRRALEPFFTTRGPRGVGLGLSVSHSIVQRHGGDLTIESGRGPGTVVTIRLPRVGAARAAAAPLAPAAAAHRVLVIEDEAEVRAMLVEALESLGHEVVEAGSGREALARLEAGATVDLVLTDLGMPEMNGWDVARAIKARWPGLTVGLITGWGVKPEATPEDRSQVAFVLAKPFTLDDLSRAVAAAPPGR